MTRLRALLVAATIAISALLVTVAPAKPAHAINYATCYSGYNVATRSGWSVTNAAHNAAKAVAAQVAGGGTWNVIATYGYPGGFQVIVQKLFGGQRVSAICSVS